jgi:hypothetical protein
MNLFLNVDLLLESFIRLSLFSLQRIEPVPVPHQDIPKVVILPILEPIEEEVEILERHPESTFKPIEEQAEEEATPEVAASRKHRYDDDESGARKRTNREDSFFHAAETRKHRRDDALESCKRSSFGQSS